MGRKARMYENSNDKKKRGINGEREVGRKN